MPGVNYVLWQCGPSAHLCSSLASAVSEQFTRGMTCQELISFGNAAIQRICAQGLRKEPEPWTAGSKPCMARSPALSATLGRDLVSCQRTECCQSPVMQCLRTCTQQAEACRSTYAHSLCLLAQPTRSQLWGGAAVPSFTISVLLGSQSPVQPVWRVFFSQLSQALQFQFFLVHSRHFNQFGEFFFFYHKL